MSLLYSVGFFLMKGKDVTAVCKIRPRGMSINFSFVYIFKGIKL